MKRVLTVVVVAAIAASACTSEAGDGASTTAPERDGPTPASTIPSVDPSGPSASADSSAADSAVVVGVGEVLGAAGGSAMDVACQLDVLEEHGADPVGDLDDMRSSIDGLDEEGRLALLECVNGG